ncbi:MAG: hypothetical protein WD669_03455 [Pirellulales bacterium]
MAMKHSSGIIGLTRLFWMMAESAITFFLPGTILQNGNGWFAPEIIALPIVSIGMIIARRLDPETAYCDPSTSTQLGNLQLAQPGAD